jgi:lysophospholipase L1-like esterase
MQLNSFHAAPSSTRSSRIACATAERLESRRLFASTSPTVGVIGDSYSDEYQFYAPDRSTASNYVEQLAEDRNLNFGAFSETLRPEPRNAGFAQNWARSGDTSSDALAHGQHTSLASQVGTDGVRYAFVFLGGNDFRGVFTSPDPLGTLAAVVPAATTNIGTAITALLAAGPQVRVVVATVPGVGILPEVRGAVAFNLIPQALVDGVDAAADALNQQIIAMGDASNRVAVADVAGLADRIFAGKAFKVAGVKLDRDVPSNDGDHVFLADGIHAGTVVQGLIANRFIRAMNQEFGTHVKRLRAGEILTNAGLSPGKGDPGNAVDETVAGSAAKAAATPRNVEASATSLVSSYAGSGTTATAFLSSYDGAGTTATSLVSSFGGSMATIGSEGWLVRK